jgi:O-acetylhomoserine (thiol)-lyase
MPAPRHKFDTLKVRAGYQPKDHQNAIAVPIYQTASFDLGSTARVDRLLSFQEAGWLYTRVANPTVDVLEQRVAALDGGTAAVAVASGMAAISYTLLNLAEGGGRILTTPRVYGGTFDAFHKILGPLGIGVDFAEDSDDPESFRRALKPNTKAILIESISNPTATILDVEAIAAVAHDFGVPLVIDNTFATPYLFNPLAHGADIVVYSATKALNGHGNTIGGVIVESGTFPWNNGKFPQFTTPTYLLRDRATGVHRSFLEAFPAFPFVTRVRLNYLAYLGAALGPFDAFLILQGIETLSERVAKQVANAVKVVRFLESHPQVSWVSHPAAQKSKYAALAKRYFPRGAGSVFAFGFKGTEAQYNAFIDAVKVFSFHANVGDARSLVINSPKTTHGELTPAEQALAGITPDTIRLSIGIEDARDLVADLRQAFKVAALS